MGKRLALAIVASALLLAATIGFARPRRAAPPQATEHRAVADTLGDPELPAIEARDAALDLLLHDLRHGSTLERARAARRLARLGPLAAPAIGDLVEFLCDKEDGWRRVRDEIEDILVAIGEEAVPAALDLIAQPGAAGRRSGIEILARIRGEAAVPVLAPLLGDKAVGVCAARRLARLGEAGRAVLVAAVTDAAVPLERLEDAIADAGKPIALPLAVLLEDEEQVTRERAAAMLAKLGKNARPAADAILRALSNPAFGDRLSLAEALVHFDQVPAAAAPILAELARSLVSTKAGADVRRCRVSPGLSSQYHKERARELAPLRALANLGPDGHSVLPVLLEIMASGDPDAGAAAARAFWRVGGDPETAAQHLVANLAAFPDGGYHPAMAVLTEMKADGASAVPWLLHELGSGKLNRASGAGVALVAMGEAGVSAVREWLPTAGTENVHTVFIHFGDALQDDLVARFGQEARDYFEFVGMPFTVEADPEAWADLQRKARDPEKRVWTFLALRSMGEKAAPAVPDLVALLADDDLRIEVAQALGSIGPAAAAAIPALEPYLEDPTSARRDVAVALYRITGDTRYRDLVFEPSQVQADDDWALPRLIEGLSARSTWWRRECAEALGRLGATARPAAADLARLAADHAEDEYVRDAARDALRSIAR